MGSPSSPLCCSGPERTPRSEVRLGHRVPPSGAEIPGRSARPASTFLLSCQPRRASRLARSLSRTLRRKSPDYQGFFSTGATGLEPAASGVTEASTGGLDTHESPLYKPNLSFRGQGCASRKKPHFAGFCRGFGHKSRLVPNRFDLPLAPPERAFAGFVAGFVPIERSGFLAEQHPTASGRALVADDGRHRIGRPADR
jgi:hypothetical protein